MHDTLSSPRSVSLPSNRLVRCAVGLLVLLAATLLRYSFEPVLQGDGPYIIHLAGIVIAAWIAGIEGGICALLPGASVLHILVLDRLSPSRSHVAGVVLFLVSGFVCIWVVHRWHRLVGAEHDAREEIRILNGQLERRVSEVEGLLALTPVGLAISSDSACREMRSNKALRQMLGVDAETNISVTAPAHPPWKICRNGRELTGDELPMQRCAAHGVVVEGEQCDLVFDDGRQTRLLVSATPLLDDDGMPAGCIGALVDVSVQKELEEQLREANRAKDAFLASLSHELRTPLSAVLGWAKLLASERLDANGQRQAIEAIARNAEVQNRLVSDTLDVSRIIAGKVRLEPRQVELASLVRHGIASATPAAREKGVELRLESCPDGCVLYADPDRLQQVLWNLLSNAIKFTPAGGRVVVSVTSTTSSVDLVVQDNGLGIDARFMPRVFDRFAQADTSTSRRHGGLGLGLSIVKRLVELHGGDVSVASQGEGKGSRFTVSLPIRAVPPAVASLGDPPWSGASSASGLARTSLSGLRAFVVDDNTDARQLIAAVLKPEGVDVMSFESADEALLELPKSRPEVIVADIGMPETDGYEFIRRVRTFPDEEVASTPAIALTAFASSTDRASALAAGFQEHLAKPVLPETLVEAVAAAARMPRAAASRTESPS